jgi:8-oxo-dGTP pyrophosphatase MutT (NUDIX family)
MARLNSLILAGIALPHRIGERLMLHAKALSVGVRAVVEDGDGKILLVRHTYIAGWYFPGGGLNRGESAIEGLERELTEEVQLCLTGPAELHGVYFNRKLAGRDHVLVYRCPHWERESEFRPSIEIAEARFFSLDNLPADLSGGTARRLAELYRGEAIVTEW